MENEMSKEKALEVLENMKKDMDIFTDEYLALGIAIDMMNENKDEEHEDKELRGSLKEASRALDKIFNRPVERSMETLTELEKAIKEDREWAKQTQIILENFNDEDEKSKSLAFLNGVLFATGRYNDILDEMKED